MQITLFHPKPISRVTYNLIIYHPLWRTAPVQSLAMIINAIPQNLYCRGYIDAKTLVFSATQVKPICQWRSCWEYFSLILHPVSRQTEHTLWNVKLYARVLLRILHHSKENISNGSPPAPTALCLEPGCVFNFSPVRRKDLNQNLYPCEYFNVTWNCLPCVCILLSDAGSETYKLFVFLKENY